MYLSTSSWAEWLCVEFEHSIVYKRQLLFINWLIGWLVIRLIDSLIVCCYKSHSRIFHIRDVIVCKPRCEVSHFFPIYDLDMKWAWHPWILSIFKGLLLQSTAELMHSIQISELLIFQQFGTKVRYKDSLMVYAGFEPLNTMLGLKHLLKVSISVYIVVWS